MTPLNGLANRRMPDATAYTPSTCGNPPPALGAVLGASAPEIDPDLAAVAAAWTHLPEAIKAGIVAMVLAVRNQA